MSWLTSYSAFFKFYEICTRPQTGWPDDKMSHKIQTVRLLCMFHNTQHVKNMYLRVLYTRNMSIRDGRVLFFMFRIFLSERTFLGFRSQTAKTEPL